MVLKPGLASQDPRPPPNPPLHLLLDAECKVKALLKPQVSKVKSIQLTSGLALMCVCVCACAFVCMLKARRRINHHTLVLSLCKNQQHHQVDQHPHPIDTPMPKQKAKPALEKTKQRKKATLQQNNRPSPHKKKLNKNLKLGRRDNNDSEKPSQTQETN